MARAQPGTTAALHAGQTVLFNLTTLRSLAGAGHLDALLRTLKVHLGSADQTQLNAETLGADHQTQTYQDHLALWQKIQGDTRFAETNFSARKNFAAASWRKIKSGIFHRLGSPGRMRCR